MNRSRTITAVLAATVLLLANVIDSPGATKKKKASSDGDASDQGPGATPSLNLPLPTKSKTNAAASPTPAKKADDSEGTPGKTPKPSADSKSNGKYGPDATVEPEEIAEFDAQPKRVQQLIRDAVDLTRLNLTYTFGSADPDQGGMDCSGTIYYLLRAHNFTDVPRDSAGQYLWARRGCGFFPVVARSADSPEFKELQPGDLMFWTGTYESGRDIPISHVMMYLGKEKASGKRIMFGSSDGRSYNGVQRWGVSVFDFKMPKADPTGSGEKTKAEFVGFARIPGLRSAAPPMLAGEEKSNPEKKEAATPTPTPPKKTNSSSRKKKKPTPSDN
ncbi:MAG TPA: NlpC/P60 family protein [Chthoniobacter sp.]|jgi:cell wall-associated NlpC family hydrolase